MKHLQGKKIYIDSITGKSITGLVVGANDELIRVLVDGQTDERVIFVKNIYSYQVIGEGVSGGYSGIKVYVCKNLNIGCKGRIKLSGKQLKIQDMGCKVCLSEKGKNFHCDFGNVGAMEVLPSKVQKILFEGLLKDNNEKKEIEK